ncbi:hypothetical protein JTB14_032452 [Gonioctena quinquepunctata]|nr:hypothetical protein JTB14_032452 [Gonioctena quinquepunctata]
MKQREKRAQERTVERAKAAEPKDELYHFFMSMYQITKKMSPNVSTFCKNSCFQRCITGRSSEFIDKCSYISTDLRTTIIPSTHAYFLYCCTTRRTTWISAAMDIKDLFLLISEKVLPETSETFCKTFRFDLL